MTSGGGRSGGSGPKASLILFMRFSKNFRVRFDRDPVSAVVWHMKIAHTCRAISAVIFIFNYFVGTALFIGLSKHNYLIN